MRMSCNGCRVLRKGCSEDCSIRPCLQWIKNPESQANATVFLAKFYGRAGLMNLINAGPESLRPGSHFSILVIRSMWSNCEPNLWFGGFAMVRELAAMSSRRGSHFERRADHADNIRSRGSPPLKAYDIRHVSKDENSANETPKAKTRSRFNRTGSTLIKPKASKGTPTGFVPIEPVEPETANRTTSHESGLSHLSEAAVMVEGESKESESDVSVETSNLFHEEPESVAKTSDRTGESGNEIGLELTLGFEPVSRVHHVVPMKKRKIIASKSYGDSAEKDSCKMELGLEYPA
ncbi:hypothetical protein JHK85_053208 [Glycine max]|nr:hypothetical protein JHK85_053208 [Glycine max]